MKFNVEVTVEFKKGILDPQSQAIAGAIVSLGYESVKEISMSKRFNLVIVGDSQGEVEKTVEELCKKLLANTVIENYQYAVENSEGK
ncbi:phosphoribosylformylglycinamidine synthase subunit PurS [Alkalicella caledoniensis]|uniref:Phosphoribosylformylglycinamidine synthase subunit PurS n=1 Tax=Alkalicella caledoniensis TaxID=2731377 RepID=A0A7G9W985_ALKCA|nr:phosphoribosylformylglycinamidine synthase subunit PurS [Alkalicella caledoniensis]QNO15247.1 phosphoribosylformylglycinamidine synthase subunit PurS [Alkalicella caledoniensis]